MSTLKKDMQGCVLDVMHVLPMPYAAPVCDINLDGRKTVHWNVVTKLSCSQKNLLTMVIY